MMSQSIAQQVAKHNIYIGVVAPGFVETDMAAKTLSGQEGENIRHQSPLKRVARPEEVAYAVLFLARRIRIFNWHHHRCQWRLLFTVIMGQC
jgi:3-oxoacyl-[acyl-carrier protein] reductase